MNICHCTLSGTQQCSQCPNNPENKGLFTKVSQGIFQRGKNDTNKPFDEKQKRGVNEYI